MSWIKLAQSRLGQGEHVEVRPSGHSMTGVIDHRDRVLLAPIDPSRLEVSDAVLVRVAGQVYLHLVKSIDTARQRVLIGNNRGKVNGSPQREQASLRAGCELRHALLQARHTTGGCS